MRIFTSLINEIFTVWASTLVHHVFSVLKVFLLRSPACQVSRPSDDADYVPSILCSLREKNADMCWWHTNAPSKMWRLSLPCTLSSEGGNEPKRAHVLELWQEMRCKASRLVSKHFHVLEGEDRRREKEGRKKERRAAMRPAPVTRFIRRCLCSNSQGPPLKLTSSQIAAPYNCFDCFFQFIFGARMLSTLDRIASHVSSHILHHIAWWVSREALLQLSWEEPSVISASRPVWRDITGIFHPLKHHLCRSCVSYCYFGFVFQLGSEVRVYRLQDEQAASLGSAALPCS